MFLNGSLEQLRAHLAHSMSASVSGDSDSVFDGVSTDTRSLSGGELFVALKGPNFDGHRFLAQAKEAGAVAAIVEEVQPIDLPQLQVDNSLLALGLIGELNRQLFSGRVYAVTGSAGKTTVKEMLANILSGVGSVISTKGNLNNDIGAPLTLLTIDKSHENAVIELGASAVGEIDYTAELTQPDVSILTNAMGAHLEGFGSLQNIVKAKSEIFDGLKQNGCAVVNLDDAHASIWLDKLAVLGKRVVRFGVDNSQADVYAENLRLQDNGCYQFTLSCEQGRVEINLPVLGRHMVANAVAAAAACLSQSVSLHHIAEGLESFCAVKGRMQPNTMRNGCVVIDDSYNANPSAVMAAIDALVSLPGNEKILVLGDMGELGEDEQRLHAEVGEYAAEKGVSQLFAVGELSQHAVTAFNKHVPEYGHGFSQQQDLISALAPVLTENTRILIKGSRSAGMDKVVAALLEGE